jgi:DNA-binding HxlR family transcriptional regulator
MRAIGPKSSSVSDEEERRDAGCRVDATLKFLAREWTSHILWMLAREPAMRFGALRRALPGAISARVLSARLKELEAHGLVSRHDAGSKPLHVEYRLTAAGRSAALSESPAAQVDLSRHRRIGFDCRANVFTPLSCES